MQHIAMHPLFSLALVACASAATFRAQPGSMDQSLANCVAGLKNPGDRCELAKGRYTVNDVAEGVLKINGKHGAAGNPMVIASATGNPDDVVIDGTLPVGQGCDGSWQPYTSDAVLRGQRNGAAGQPYVCNLAGVAEVNQLFIDGEMQVVARWPNARFDDKSMYMAPANWAHSTEGSFHDPVKTGMGLVVDAGACANPNDCCSTCNTHDLAASGVNVSGAIAVMNFWANGVGGDKVTTHVPGTSNFSYVATWCKSELSAGRKCQDGYRLGGGRYYLEATLNLLDGNTEWFFDGSSSKLYVWTKDGQQPAPGSVAYKAQVYAMQIDDASFLTIANMTFFGTTLKAHGSDQTHLTFESLDFTYPDSSRRMSGDWRSQNTTLVYNDKHSSVTNHLFYGCSFRYADAAGLVAQGGGNKFRSCLWEWNSWTSLCMGTAGANDGNCGTFFPKGAPPQDETPTCDRLTFRFNGPSKCLRPDSARLVNRTHFEGQLELASDGCFVESGGPQSAHLAYNWAFDSGKLAARFDGSDHSGTANGVMTHNVAWNVSSFSLHGNHHMFDHNTAFDPSDISSSYSKKTFPSAQTQDSDLDGVRRGDGLLSAENPGVSSDTANMNSTFEGNLLTSVKAWKGCKKGAEAACPFPGTWKDNLVRSSMPYDYSANGSHLTYFHINSELRWPWGRDFRSCPGSHTAQAGAGAYPVYTPTDTQHWIPGALQRVPTMESPKDGEGKAIVDADLMFLPVLRAVAHKVFFGTSADKLALVGTVAGEDNLVQTPAKDPNTKYFWRVDAQFVDGTSASGPVWSFTTGDASHVACPAAPPTPPLPAPISEECETQLEKTCGKWKGATVQCLNIVHRQAGSGRLPACAADDLNQYCKMPPTNA
eukprot:TRINITY_DN2918_c0_g3_i1.p1 TRINITY_DN2918_c0_g3~~TRINITY_DN2918_c0_g3_i1.p1  ORF type:complete len:876 (+),score=300.88 TRINITY_DN2918_c0_g3_i1:43-2670(+)